MLRYVFFVEYYDPHLVMVSGKRVTIIKMGNIYYIYNYTDITGITKTFTKRPFLKKILNIHITLFQQCFSEKE